MRHILSVSLPSGLGQPKMRGNQGPISLVSGGMLNNLLIFFLTMGSDFLAVAADRADKQRKNMYICLHLLFFFVPLNYHADSFQCVRTLRAPAELGQSPSPPVLQDFTVGWLRAAAPLQRQSWRSHSWWAVFCFFRTSSRVPSYFQHVIFLLKAEQIVLFPRRRAVPSSSPCLLSSTGAQIPSQRQDIASHCPAFSSVTCELIRKHPAPVYSRGFWAHMDSATTLSSLTRVRCCTSDHAADAAQHEVGSPESF